MMMIDRRQPVAKRIAKALGAENYNILQNNGRLAHQVVGHVCGCLTSWEAVLLIVS